MDAIAIAGKLLDIHTHGDHVEPEEVVYREADIIQLLVSLGYPVPDFEGYAKILDIKAHNA